MGDEFTKEDLDRLEKLRYLGGRYRDTVTNFVGMVTGVHFIHLGSAQMHLEKVHSADQKEPVKVWIEADRLIPA